MNIAAIEIEEGNRTRNDVTHARYTAAVATALATAYPGVRITHTVDRHTTDGAAVYVDDGSEDCDGRNDAVSDAVLAVLDTAWASALAS
jgi:hypothetical protein